MLHFNSLRMINSITFNTRYTFIPPSCYDISLKPNPILSVKLGNNNSVIGTIDIRLFENVVPKTAENYKRLFLETAQYQSRKLSLIGTGISRYVPRAFIQMGTLPSGNCSIYGPKFRDQSFELLHDRQGLLSSISEQNTNSSEFLITLAPCPFLDYKNIVFGEIVPKSMKMLRNLQKLGDQMKKISILSVQQVQQIVQSHHNHDHH